MRVSTVESERLVLKLPPQTKRAIKARAASEGISVADYLERLSGVDGADAKSTASKIPRAEQCDEAPAARPRSREGTKAPTAHVPQATAKRFARLAVDLDRSHQDLIEEAIADLFAKIAGPDSDKQFAAQDSSASRLRRGESGKRLSAYVPPEMAKELRVRCARERRSVSDAVTEALGAWLRRDESGSQRRRATEQDPERLAIKLPPATKRAINDVPGMTWRPYDFKRKACNTCGAVVPHQGDSPIGRHVSSKRHVEAINEKLKLGPACTYVKCGSDATHVKARRLVYCIKTKEDAIRATSEICELNMPDVFRDQHIAHCGDAFKLFDDSIPF